MSPARHRPECSLNPRSRRRFVTPGRKADTVAQIAHQLQHVVGQNGHVFLAVRPRFPGAGPSTTHVTGSAPAPMCLANDGLHTHCNLGVIRTCLQAGFFNKPSNLPLTQTPRLTPTGPAAPFRWPDVRQGAWVARRGTDLSDGNGGSAPGFGEVSDRSNRPCPVPLRCSSTMASHAASTQPTNSPATEESTER